MQFVNKILGLATAGVLIGVTSAIIATPAHVNAPEEVTNVLASNQEETLPKAVVTLPDRDGLYTVYVKPPEPEVDESMIASNDIHAFVTNSNWEVQWPFPVGVHISSGFGKRVAPCKDCPSNHTGTDFAIGGGTPVQPIAAGEVVAVGWDGGYGYRVIIEHIIDGEKVLSLYGHLIENSSPLKQGDMVKTGDLIGKVGSTGKSTGNHLHLEITTNNIRQDPEKWLKEKAGKATVSLIQEQQ